MVNKGSGLTVLLDTVLSTFSIEALYNAEYNRFTKI